MSRPVRGPGAHGIRLALVPAVVLVAWLAFPRATPVVPDLAAGSVAPAGVIAPVRFLVLKDEATRAREAEALASTVNGIVTANPGVAAAAAGAASVFFARLDSAAAAGLPLPDAVRGSGLTLSDTDADILARPVTRRAWRQSLIRTLTQSASGFLGPGVSDADLGSEVVLRRGERERVVPVDSVRTFSDFLTQPGAVPPELTEAEERLFVRLLGVFYQPTLVYERAETERRRDALRASVDSVASVVLAGQKIVDAHEVVTEEVVRELNALRMALGSAGMSGSAVWLRTGGALGADMLILLLFGVICLLFRPELYRSLHALVFIALTFAVVVAVAGLVARYAPDRVELIPVALSAILLSVLFDGRIAAVAAMALAAFLAVQPAWQGGDALIVTFAGGVAAALSMRRIRSRTQVYSAIGVVTLMYAVVSALSGAASGEPIEAIGVSALLGGVNAMGSAAVAMLALPLAETFTRSTTDLRLLELSDPNQPLLRRLATEAPGTYAHSVAMANLCEAACNAIGANGLLARVGCYYHDVGKLKHPQFFVENLGHARNPHLQMSAEQSVTLIRRHVADGLALAEAHHVPDVLRAFIPEHHGTAPITYFLEKAREAGGTVDEDDYRYPGPRPQSAETAVALLADAVEAALRVLDEPTPDTIADAIEHLVDQRIAGGQLADAPLTLRQIETVKREFERVLTAANHQRLDYPEDAGGLSADWESPRAG